ncbi:hypothetical protein [Telluribacter humicola]|uniref:hypothetical protein n=1 Tax=Telluribacter humicola TaxID=1720261 RepID=UPI001A977F59|nr:hypothetical protein [Telluribacter humicola]
MPQNAQMPEGKRLRSAQEILEGHIQQGLDPVEMERNLNELLIHYLRPMGEHQVSPEYATELYSTYYSLRNLIADISMYKCQMEAYQQNASTARPPFR